MCIILFPSKSYSQFIFVILSSLHTDRSLKRRLKIKITNILKKIVVENKGQINIDKKNCLKCKKNRFLFGSFADKLGCFFRNELHFIVKGYANVPARDMVKILSDVSDDDHAQFDAFVCCIASHGRKGTLFGSDCREIKVHEITGLFTGSRCVSLSGKPKCFFIQGCCGDHFSLKGTYSQKDY